MIAVCDGLKGLPEAISTVGPQLRFKPHLHLRIRRHPATKMRISDASSPPAVASSSSDTSCGA